MLEVVVNSLRRYLKLSPLQLPVSSLLAFACCLGQQLRGPAGQWHISFRRPLGERARERERRSSLSGCQPSSPPPPVTLMRDLYIYIFTHTPHSSRLGQGLHVVGLRPCKSFKTLQIYGREENVSRCGIVTTQRSKQTLGASLEAVCDRGSVGKQPKVLFQAGMMSFQRDQHGVVEATWLNSSCNY